MSLQIGGLVKLEEGRKIKDKREKGNDWAGSIFLSMDLIPKAYFL